MTVTPTLTGNSMPMRARGASWLFWFIYAGIATRKGIFGVKNFPPCRDGLHNNMSDPNPMELQFDQISPVLAKFLARYGFGPDCAITLAGTAGSRRVYFRLTSGLRTFIVLVSPPDDADFGRFLRITQFYRLMDFPVPMVYCIDDAAHQVVLEDLGDKRLYDLVKSGAPRLEPYRKVIHQ